MAGVTSILFRAARVSADARALSSPTRAANRVKNVALGRALGRAGAWRWLWKGWF
jgi:hypothetical protein